MANFNLKTRPSTLGERATRARLRKGMTQRDVAEFIGITQASICNIERGVNDPSLATLIDICEALDVSPNYILGWTRR